MKGQYLIPKLQKDANFWQMVILHHVLSEDLNKSHNFIILSICDVTLYHSYPGKGTMFCNKEEINHVLANHKGARDQLV